ncbi:hypothetical protein KCV05_g23317, partial [Aureobasidium melanogenum]
DQTSFEVTIPEDLGSKCSTPGACVLQHFWDARSVDQTYESCIDFTVSGSGSGAAPASSKAASSSAAPVSSQVAASSSAPAKAPITSTQAASSAAQPTTMATSVKSSAASVSSSSASGSVAAWGQCGGKGFTGATACVSGYTCKVQNDYYSQCVPGENKVTDASSPAASSSSCTTTITLTKSSSAAANTM